MGNQVGLSKDDVTRIKKAREEIARMSRASEGPPSPPPETDESSPEHASYPGGDPSGYVQSPLPFMPKPVEAKGYRVNVVEFLGAHRERLLSNMDGVSEELRMVSKTMNVLQNLAFPCPNQSQSSPCTPGCPICRGQGMVRPIKVEAVIGSDSQ